MMQYQIRQAEPADQEQILQLARDITDRYTRTYLGDKLVDWYLDSGACDEEILQNYDQLLVMLDGNTVIGLMIWKENLMHLLMVAIPYHGTGAAQYFCNQVIPEKRKEFGELKLECFEANARANQFYRKTGWTEYARIPDELTGGSRILYHMGKEAENHVGMPKMRAEI